MEKKGIDENGEECDVDWDGGEDSGNGGGKEDDLEEDDLLGDELEETREHKRKKNCNVDSSLGKEGYKERGHELNEEEFQEFLRWKASEVLNKSVNLVIEEAASKILGEDGGIPGLSEEDVLSAGKDKMVMGERSTAAKVLGHGDALMEEADLSVSAAETFKMGKQGAPEVDGMVEEIKEQMEDPAALVANSEKLSVGKFKAAASVPEMVLAPARSSPRLVGSTDEHTLLKAKRRVESRNLEKNKGNGSTNSKFFFSIPLCQAVDSLKALGLTSGDKSIVSFESSVERFLNEERNNFSRLTELAREDQVSLESDTDDIENFEKKAVNFLCGDLMEEVFDDDRYHLSCGSNIVQRKPGAKSSRKRASRVLKIKINRFSSK